MGISSGWEFFPGWTINQTAIVQKKEEMGGRSPSWTNWHDGFS